MMTENISTKPSKNTAAKALKDKTPKRKTAQLLLGEGVKQRDYLKNAMSVLKLSRQELADQLGVSVHTVHNWMMPESTEEFRHLSLMAFKFIEEILRSAGRSTNDGREKTRPLRE